MGKSGWTGLLLIASWAATASAEPVDFSKEIGPLLSSRCVSCHGTRQAKGGLSLATRKDASQGGDSGPAIVAGKPDESSLLEVIVGAEPGAKPEMPKTGAPLTREEVERLRQWIAEGAVWPAEVALQEPRKGDLSWWALQPLHDVEPTRPHEVPPGWSDNPIDRFILAGLDRAGLRPSPEADRRVLIRRVRYDLTGLPPTPEEVDAFVNDPRTDAYERLVERLLASPQYGEHWGRHWLDVARFGESTGFERNVIIDNAWPYRDYVIHSFNDDKPFNQFVVEQIAGDVVAQGDPNIEVGTTFLVAGPYDNVGNQDPVQARQIRANTLDEIVTTVGTAFLGMTINCARCHDHKFDPIPMADYYRLQATFSGVSHGERVLASPVERAERDARLKPLNKRVAALRQELADLDKAAVERGERELAKAEPTASKPEIDTHGTEDRFPPVQAKQVRLTILASDRDPRSSAGTRIDEFEVWTSGEKSRNVALASQGARAEAPARVARDFAGAYSPELTIDGKFGAAWVAVAPRNAQLTITLAQPETIDRVVFSSDRPRAIAGRSPYTVFVGEYRIEVSSDGQAWTTVADSGERPPISPAFRQERYRRRGLTEADEARQTQLRTEIARTEAEIRAVPPLRQFWAGVFSQPSEPGFIMLGGDASKHGPAVTPASLSMLSRVAKPYELKPDAPEAERRLALARWLVADDNPLTPRVIVNRIWKDHFGVGIVDTPSDFGELGGRPSHPELLDWLALQLRHDGWRLKPLHRRILLSRTYRQASADRADGARIDASARWLWRFPPRRLAAEEVRDTILALASKLDTRLGGPGFRLYTYLNDNVSTYVPRDEVGPETYRRAVYHQNARASRVDMLSDFDCPDNSGSAPTRVATTTPLQALTLLNHGFTRDMAAALATRLTREAGSEPAAQVDRAFALSFNRAPDPTERDASVDLIHRFGLSAFCRALLNTNELIAID